ncbi:MAG: type I-U CRISPR-associated protein Csx17 [Acidimicrobiales bacterium]|nr:type I-U CRISPR-associated protein Csx17 [Acidimicrobiales bacterium]
MTTIRLDGCRVEPIAGYLKAHGVLRLVSSQVDPAARAFWRGDTFHLDSVLDADGLVEFFVKSYSPTPLVSPWNGGSGFDAPTPDADGKKIKPGLGSIETTDDPRFANYRAAVEAVRSLMAAPSWEMGSKEQKQQQVMLCRGALPDAALDWIDASVVLASDRLVFPGLFGTGGNDGRLDFSNNFMQRLAELFLAKRSKSAADPAVLLRGAIFGSDSGPLIDASVGQYDPSAGESESGSTLAKKSNLANPWDFILLLEGSLVFASSVARRMGSERGLRAAMPFCVDGSPVGHSSSAEGEDSRGELWAPVWVRPASAEEVARLIGEGRADWRGRSASSGTDFAKAVATLGVDRGIDRFVRHGLVQRNGLSFLAVPLGAVKVGGRPEVNVFGSVDTWLESLPRELPAAAASARRRLEAAEFRAASGQESVAPAAFQAVLAAVADLENTIGRSQRHVRDCKPVGATRGTRLPAADWLRLLDDGTPEFRLASALASGRDRAGPGAADPAFQTGSSLALLLRPVCLADSGYNQWAVAGPRVDGLGRRRVDQLLADALVVRAIDAERRRRRDQGGVGLSLGFELGLFADLEDLLALMEDRIDIDKLGRLLPGLLMLDWTRRGDEQSVRLSRPVGGARRVKPPMSVLLPFFQVVPEGSAPLKVRTADGTVEIGLRAQRGWAQRLASDRREQVDSVLDEALARLQMLGLNPAPDRVRASPTESGPVLALAALCRISRADTVRLLSATCPGDSFTTGQPQDQTTSDNHSQETTT